MRSAKPSILFLSHDASRTGAPILLLAFLKWLRVNADYEFEVLLNEGGELEPEFASLARTSTAGIGAERYLHRLSGTLPTAALRMIRRERLRAITHRRTGFDLLYSNTLQNGALLRALWRPPVKVISHVHELTWWLSYQTEPEGLRYTKTVTDQYVACSRATLDNLVETERVPRDQVTLCHAFIDVDETAVARARAARQATRQRLGIPSDALVVGGMGTMDWRKGTDLFVQLAGQVARRVPAGDVYFVWVGGSTEGPVAGGLRSDASELGLGGRVKLIGPSDRPTELLAAMDVFALTSREDPFPLVMLEAAAAGLPVVCFAGGGGAPEFVVPGAGYVVGYLDVVDMADVVARLLQRADERERLGKVAAARVRERHTIDQAGPRLAEVIDGCLRHSSNGGVSQQLPAPSA
jgi:glycosyltransferase involved in cell wall biosynthesis